MKLEARGEVGQLFVVTLNSIKGVGVNCFANKTLTPLIEYMRGLFPITTNRLQENSCVEFFTSEKRKWQPNELL